MNGEIVPNFPDGKEFTLFKETFPNALNSIDDIAAGYTEIMTAMEQLDSNRDNEILFLMVGACYTEYEEILLLSLNGYGSGGTKLLRALYERVVTMLCLMRHPDKIQQFIDYTHVHWNKLLIEADMDGVAEELSEKRREEIVANFEGVKDQFSEPRCTETTCKNSGKTRLQGSWTKKPVPTQAREVVPELGLLCFQSYLMPTFFLTQRFGYFATDKGTREWQTGAAQQGDGTSIYPKGRSPCQHPNGASRLRCTGTLEIGTARRFRANDGGDKVDWPGADKSGFRNC